MNKIRQENFRKEWIGILSKKSIGRAYKTVVASWYCVSLFSSPLNRRGNEIEIQRVLDSINSNNEETSNGEMWAKALLFGVLSIDFPCFEEQFLAILKQCAIRDSLPYLRPALLFASKKIGEEQAFSMCEEERDIEYCNNAVFVVKDMRYKNDLLSLYNPIMSRYFSKILENTDLGIFSLSLFYKPAGFVGLLVYSYIHRLYETMKDQLEVSRHLIIRGFDGITLNLLDNLSEKMKDKNLVNDDIIKDQIIRIYFSISSA